MMHSEAIVCYLLTVVGTVPLYKNIDVQSLDFDLPENKKWSFTLVKLTHLLLRKVERRPRT